MFILHSSNKSENLLAHLQVVLEGAPLTSAFDKEIFLIQSQGMERWLSQQMAASFSVWGNFKYLFPGRFFSEIAERIDLALASDAFERDLMVWKIEAQLRDLDEDVFKPIQFYVDASHADLKRFQLARQLAQTFDQYQMMRPDMLAQWQQGELLYGDASEKWQCALWQRLTEMTPDAHRGAVRLQLIEHLQKTAPGTFAKALPQRISVFGINSLPPLFLAFLQALSRHCDVHFYLLNPVQIYWADVSGKTLQAQLQEINAHPLLVAWAQQGREFQQMLLEQGQFELELDSFEELDIGNNLQQIQQDVLNNTVEFKQLTQDDSLVIHACHSHLREVQVVRQQLLLALEQDDTLQLRDIVVMAPDIQHYAPFISAEFADIQHSVADRNLRLSNALLDVFVSFLQVCQSRFGWQQVMQLLEQPQIYPHFDLNEDDVQLIRFWVADLQVRWARDAEHKQQLQLPKSSGNSWQAALDRLLMGYACAHEDFIDGVLPYAHIEGLSAQALGGLYDFLMLLFKSAVELAKEKTLQDWSEELYQAANALLGVDETKERRQLNEIILALGGRFADVSKYPVSLSVIIHWLQERMEESKSSSGFLRGQLTFCSMLPMRSIPFKVIVLMGMSEGEFPRVERPPTFDLLDMEFRLGDRSRRADDRYHFLETLLSARQQLVITYIGQSIKDNECMPPSVVISELLDVLSQHYQLNDVIVRHPLHAFSRTYFNGSQARLFSYQAQDCATAEQLLQEVANPQCWWQGETQHAVENIIEIADLLAFFRHPQKHFLKRQLNMRLLGLDAEAQEREHFALDGLENYQLQQTWLAAELQNKPLSLHKLQASGLWLEGAVGEVRYQQDYVQVQTFAEKIRDLHVGEPCEALSIDMPVGDFRLLGKLGNIYQNASLLCRLSNVKGKDFIIAWLHHLIASQLTSKDTYLLAKDNARCFPAKLGSQQDLHAMLKIYQQGQQRPDAFFSESIFDYLKAAQKGKLSREQILDKCRKELLGRIEKGLEEEIAQLFTTQQAVNALFDQAFAELCEQHLCTAWMRSHDV